MFDIGPAELLVIFVVALLVIGPERLPATVKTVSLWLGRFRRSFHRIKAEVERELNADEIRRQLHNESILAEVEEAKKQAKDLKDQAKDFKDQVEKSTSDKDVETDRKPTDNKIAGPQQEGASKADSPTASPEAEANSGSDSAGSTAGKEVNQALSYVNDITREVKSSTEEIARELKQSDKQAGANKADGKS